MKKLANQICQNPQNSKRKCFEEYCETVLSNDSTGREVASIIRSIDGKKTAAKPDVALINKKKICFNFVLRG